MSDDSIRRLPLADAEVLFAPAFFSAEESDRFFAALMDEVAWTQESIRMMGKSLPIPRLTAWYGDAGKSYRWSGIEQHPLSWTPALLVIKGRVEVPAETLFNSVLLNLYRGERDSVAWHSDDEPELGVNPVIASVSLGAARKFQFKRKDDAVQRYAVDLPSGSLLIMRGTTQHFWKHQLPKTKTPQGARINLTFRVIHSASAD